MRSQCTFVTLERWSFKQSTSVPRHFSLALPDGSSATPDELGRGLPSSPIRAKAHPFDEEELFTSAPSRGAAFADVDEGRYPLSFFSIFVEFLQLHLHLVGLFRRTAF